MTTREYRSSGLALIGVGLLPFALGGVYAAIDGEGSIPGHCPFLMATGLPCPLCGATRAFGLVASGNPEFLQFNFFWVLAAAILVLVGGVVFLKRIPPPKAWFPSGRLPIYLTVGVLALGWAAALINRGWIVS